MCQLLPQKLSFVQMCRYIQPTVLATNQEKRTICTHKKPVTEEQNKNGNILYLSYHKDNLIIQIIISVGTDIYTQYL